MLLSSNAQVRAQGVVNLLFAMTLILLPFGDETLVGLPRAWVGQWGSSPLDVGSTKRIPAILPRQIIKLLRELSDRRRFASHWSPGNSGRHCSDLRWGLRHLSAHE